MNDDFVLDLNDLILQYMQGASSGYGGFGRASKKRFFSEMWVKRFSEELSDLAKKEIAQALSDHLPVETITKLQDNARMKASRSSTDDNDNELEQIWESAILRGIVRLDIDGIK